MSIKAQLEAIIYAAEEPITLDQMAALLKDDLLALKTAQRKQRQEATSEPRTSNRSRSRSRRKTIWAPWRTRRAAPPREEGKRKV